MMTTYIVFNWNICCAGVIGAAVLPVVGVGVGVVQIVRGVVNTGEAIRQRSNNKIWDDVSACKLWF